MAYPFHDHYLSKVTKILVWPFTRFDYLGHITNPAKHRTVIIILYYCSQSPLVTGMGLAGHHKLLTIRD